MIRVDLHTHSVASPDGSITLKHYEAMLASGRLQAIAITDHDQVAFAQAAQEELGPAIIIGEEITTRDGEIIGLFLRERIVPRLSIEDTVARILEQGGLVYVPHPFETVRKGVAHDALDRIAAHVAIIEGCNGRAVFQNRRAQALAWAAAHNVPVAASSDAHGIVGWGRTYSEIAEQPTSENLVRQLRQAKYGLHTVGPGILYPKLNRLQKRYRGADTK